MFRRNAAIFGGNKAKLWKIAPSTFVDPWESSTLRKMEKLRKRHAQDNDIW